MDITVSTGIREGRVVFEKKILLRIFCAKCIQKISKHWSLKNDLNNK